VHDSARLELRDALFDSPEAFVLLAEVQQVYVERYGGPDNTPLHADDFAAPTGAFMIAVLDGELVGCAGLRRYDADTVELKRMYVRTPYRRRGLGRRLLFEVEDRARQLGYRRMILETGTKQPEAVSLYQAHRYVPTENYGFHRDSPGARSFFKTL
jgi:GNAT superfamily N-acetyltransferase